MAKLNCWEIKKCGREPGGEKVELLGVCPVTVEKKLNNVHSGKNGGRSCWIVAGTLCGGKVQGTYAIKLSNCMQCDFYKSVREEEDFITPSRKLLELLD
jgi:hypothetical protein